MDTPIQITFGMMCAFVGFLMLVAVIPTTGLLWKISSKITRLCDRLEFIEDRNVDRDKRLDKHEERLDDHHERLIRLSRTPDNIGHLKHSKG